MLSSHSVPENLDLIGVHGMANTLNVRRLFSFPRKWDSLGEWLRKLINTEIIRCQWFINKSSSDIVPFRIKGFFQSACLHIGIVMKQLVRQKRRMGCASLKDFLFTQGYQRPTPQMVVASRTSPQNHL